MDNRGRQQHRYSNGQVKELLAEFHASDATSERQFWEFHASDATSERQFCRAKHLPYSTWQGWRSKEDKIMANKRHSRCATMGGQGAKEIIPFKDDLLAFMRGRRDEERYVRVFHLMQWVKQYQKAWLVQYLASKKSEAVAFNSFRSLLLRFAERHRFRHRTPCISKVTQRVLDEVWLGYAASFWSKYAQYDRSQLLNVDETAVYFDMPPGKTLAEIGKSRKVANGEKHLDRLTAVLTIRADGQPGGVIDKKELSTYPAGHFYAVQKNAWMDERVWSMYLDEVLAPCLDDASVLVVDNFECHVSDSTHEKLAETLFSVVEPLPPNSTSPCQPLDVGVMGPLKAMLKTAWL
ncbi:hypothetical protein DYB36_000892 [Aphanomyces astaci]|uniref:DDE-1 domain-containing protein n=1 Tax=Aphanomyces astaci TaxID=112090 RepID=A0A397A9X9_APHAT|nr:hypothetical protein DYB36_000892 [Aphanomyces astaci]